MTEYYSLYDATVDGATAVLPNILIGGPATTEPSKIAAFLQHCKSANKRVTFASAHYYPGACGTSPANATGLLNDNNTRVSQITSGGYTTSAVLSFNTEWNSSYCGQGGKAGDANESMDSHANAPFILKAVKLLSDKNQGETPPASVFSYWVLTDVFGESGSDTGMYIQQQGGNLPFGAVFGLVTFHGMRKAAFNGFKLLNYLGPTRLMSGGGTGGDGVDGLATKSANEDELQIIVYNYYSTVKTTGSDSVTVNVSNLPAALAGKELFVTQFLVDETHSNPYSVWVGQNKPTSPTEAQWQEMRKAQHLALAQPVSKKTVDTSFSTSFTLNRQGATLITLGLKRPLTGRNALVEIEGEDYDGQSGATKEDSNDTSLGQSISVTGNGYVYFENVDYTDGGVASVQLRVKSQAAATVELHADSPTGALLGQLHGALDFERLGEPDVHARPDGDRHGSPLPGLWRRDASQLAEVRAGNRVSNRHGRRRRWRWRCERRRGRGYGRRRGRWPGRYRCWRWRRKRDWRRGRRHERRRGRRHDGGAGAGTTAAPPVA